MEPMVTIPYGRPGAGGYREHDILVVNDDGTVDNITKFPLGPEHNIIPVWFWKFSSSMAVRSELDLWLLIQIFATLETEWFHTSPFTSPYLWDLYWGFVWKPFHWWWVSIETWLDWHPHTGASHYCVTLTPPHPPPSPLPPLTCLSASFSLFCLSRPNAPSPLTFSLSYHRSWSLFDQTLSTHNWLLTHSLPPVTVSPFILTTLGSLSYFVQLTSSFWDESSILFPKMVVLSHSVVLDMLLPPVARSVPTLTKSSVGHYSLILAVHKLLQPQTKYLVLICWNRK